MADSTDAWVARQNIRRFEKMLEREDSLDEKARLEALLALEQRKLDGEDAPRPVDEGEAGDRPGQTGSSP